MTTKNFTHREARRFRIEKLNDNLESILAQIQVVQNVIDALDFPAYETVTALPSSIADGVIVLYNKTLWRGLKAGESAWPAGTPWPVSGVKTAFFTVNHDASILTSKFSGFTPTEESNFSFYKVSTGIYQPKYSSGDIASSFSKYSVSGLLLAVFGAFRYDYSLNQFITVNLSVELMNAVFEFHLFIFPD
jgi:hypothetical protein